MGITVTTAKGKTFSNETTRRVTRKIFKSKGAQFKYIMKFLRETCEKNGTAKGPSALKDARFLYYKTNGDYFDKVEFDIHTSDKDLNSLTEILWNSSEEQSGS